MATPSEALSQRAYVEAQKGVVAAVADNLHTRRNLLEASGMVASPPEPDWDALAREAITQRTIAGNALPGEVDRLIPTTERVNAIAQDVATGVGENTGSMGFLQGATLGQAFRGFFDMIREKGFMAAISGVFNLIFGDGTSENGQALKQMIAQNTASDIGAGVTARLQSHQAELGLSDEQVAQIGAQAQNSVRVQAGLKPLDIPGKTASAPAASGGPAAFSASDITLISTTIRSQVMNTLGLKATGDQLSIDPANSAGAANLKKIAQAAGLPGGQFNDTQKKALVDTMTAALSSVATSVPTMHDPKAINAHIKIHLENHADAMGFGTMPPADRDALLQLMSNQMTASYLTSRPVDRKAGMDYEKSMTGPNEALETQLITSRIRSSVISGLGMEEKTPGRFTTAASTASPAEPSPAGPSTTSELSLPGSKIEMLEKLVGKPLTDKQRGTIVTVITGELVQAATHTEEKHSGMDISSGMKKRLQENAGAMGLGDLSKEDQARLFTVMANEATSSYLETADPQEAKIFAATTDGATAKAKNELIAGQVRQGMFDTLAPEVLKGIEDDIIAKVREKRGDLDANPIQITVPADADANTRQTIERAEATLNAKLKQRMDGLLGNDQTLEGRARILSFARHTEQGPNKAQREAMAREVSTAMVDVLTQEGNGGKSPELLAPLMEAAVIARLEEKRWEIKGLNPHSQFELTDEMIDAAGASVNKQIKGMSKEEHEKLVAAQRLLNHASPIPSTPLEFDIASTTEYARSISSISDREPFKQMVRDMARPLAITTLKDYQYAPSMGAGPNDYQRDHIADIVAGAAADVMTNPDIPGYKKDEYVHAEITRRLQAEKENLNKDARYGGYANNPSRINLLEWSYKWEMDEGNIQEIADTTSEEIKKQMGSMEGTHMLADMNMAITPITVEAPTKLPNNNPPMLAQNNRTP